MMDTNNYGVLLSIHPEWVEKIASGRKLYEVRKRRPKMEPPFTTNKAGKAHHFSRGMKGFVPCNFV